MNRILSVHEEYRGDFQSQITGPIVSNVQGIGVGYGLFHFEPRGRIFIFLGTRSFNDNQKAQRRDRDI